MSNSQAHEPITVVSDGVTVTKRFEADEFPVPAIAFVFESDRPEPVTVRLCDTVPEGVAVHDLGFHPEYGSEYWSIDDGRIVFEYELDPGAEYTTVYGLRGMGTEDVERFLTEPILEFVDPPHHDGTNDEADAGALVADLDPIEELSIDQTGETATASTDATGVDGRETDENRATDDRSTNNETEGETRTGPNGSEESGRSGESGHGEKPGESPATGTAGTGSTASSPGEDRELPVRDVSESLVGRMADELRSEEVDPADVARLREAFDHATENGSTVARVRKLQGDVDDLLAYRDTLEEFLDENGGGDVIADLREEVLAVRSQVEDLGDEVSSNGQDLSTVVGHVGTVDDSVEDLKARIDDVEDDLEELREWRDQLSLVIAGDE